MMYIKQMVLMTVTRTLAKVTWSIKERQEGGEGEKGQGGAGEEQAAKRSALQRGYT